jgi:glycosyltransferase involved in cell wall biosynthesis
MDRANYELARHLADRGDLVHVVAHAVDRELRTRPAVMVHETPRPLGSHFLGSLLLDRRGRAVARAITAREPGARVIVNGGNCRWADVNWVHMVHHRPTLRDEGAPLAKRALNRLVQKANRSGERAALAMSRLVVANSEKTRRELVELLSLDPESIHVVPLGTDPTTFGKVTLEERTAARQRWQVLEGRPAVVFVGALGYDRNKGFDTLLRAWRRLCSNPQWKGLLLAAGAGRLAFWEREARRLGVEARVRLLGPIDAVPDLLAAADMLVSPTRYDAYGLAVHEALCRGIPAIVSRAAGISERYPPDLDGLLVTDPEDSEELAHRMEAAFLRNAELASPVERVGSALRAWSWRDMAAEIVRLAELPSEDGAKRPSVAVIEP